MRRRVRVGLIGAGTSSRAMALALGRWAALGDLRHRPEITAVSDPEEAARSWFNQIGSVRYRTAEYRELLDRADIDVLFVGVAASAQERVFRDAIDAGKDFIGDRPFGGSLDSARRIVAAIRSHPGPFVRCGTEMPFYPGAQHLAAIVRMGRLGRIIDASVEIGRGSPSGPLRPRLLSRLGVSYEYSVLACLGLDAFHIPLRLGWRPHHVYALAQSYPAASPRNDTAAAPQRNSGSRPAPPFNALLACLVADASESFLLMADLKQVAPGCPHRCQFKVNGMGGGAAFSSAAPVSVRELAVRDGGQLWARRDARAYAVFPADAEQGLGFSKADALQQMWAAYLAEREGSLGGRFGCMTPKEALASHLILDAARRSVGSGVAEGLATA